MGHKQKVIESMKAGDTHSAAVALAHWSHEDAAGSKTDPVFLETLVALNMRQRDYEAAHHNISRLIALKKGNKP